MDRLNKKRRLQLVICLFLVVLSLVVYQQLTGCDFVNYDDELYVKKNPHIMAGLTLESIIWAFTTGYASNWHPLTWMSHMLDFELYGLNPMGHHWTNLQIHIVNTVLLFLFLKWMTGAIWRSAFVAALFAVHPLHVESVAWVAERKDVLCSFFWILSMWAYVRYVRNTTKIRYVLLVIFFIFGLMSKPMIVTLPFVLLLLDFWPLSRFQSMLHKQQISVYKTIGYLVREKIPLFVLSTISSFITFFVQQQGGAVSSIETFPLKARVANAIISYTSYIGKMIWPIHLGVLYPLREWYPVQVMTSGLLLLVLSSLAVWKWRRFPYLTTGWLWYLGTLIPVIGIVQVGIQRMADRYTYIPSIGLFIIVAWGMSDITAKWRCQRTVVAVFSSIILIFYMIFTWFQVGYWHNQITLFKHTIEVTHNNSIAHCELGHALAQTGKPNEALVYYIKALQINPNYAEAYNNLGVILASQNKDKEAIINFYEALRIDSDYAGAYYNLGKVFVNQGRIEEAIVNYRKALHFSPDMTEALYNLSWILSTYENERYRNGEEAVKLAERLCKITQNNQPLALDALAAAYADAGNFDEAVSTSKKALKLALLLGPQELVLGLKKRLKLYQAKRPYRQSLSKKNEL
jgi:Flp pilus assembly protein TadD